MKALKCTLSLLILGAALNTAIAQYHPSSRSSALKIKELPLIILLQEPSPEDVESLSDEELAALKSQMTGRNTALKKAVEGYWKMSPEVMTKTQSEFDALENKDDYAHITFGEYIDHEFVKSGMSANGKAIGWTDNAGSTVPGSPGKFVQAGGPGHIREYNRETKYLVESNRITTLQIKSNYTMGKVYLPNSVPSYADMVYGIKRMQYILGFLAADPANKNMMKFIKHVKGNGPLMKEKTLYIDKKDLKDDLTEADIAAIYPYKFELVDQEKIDEAIINSDPNVMYIMLADSPGANGNSTIQGVNGAEDGKVYCTEWSMVTAQVKQSDALQWNTRIGKKNLKAFAKCAK